MNRRESEAWQAWFRRDFWSKRVDALQRVLDQKDAERRDTRPGERRTRLLRMILSQNNLWRKSFADAIDPGMENRSATKHPRSIAFLLAQVGAHAAAQFATRLQHLELTPAHAGMLRAIAASPGISQQSLATLLGMVPSRIVPFLDEFEQREIVERRDNPNDRRTYALFITEKGKQLLSQIGRVAREHDAAIVAALVLEERDLLHALLARMSDQQGLTPGVHPGFSRVDVAQARVAERSKPKRR